MAWDRYAYVNNNPVNGTDPTGHATKYLFDGFGDNSGEIPFTPSVKDATTPPSYSSQPKIDGGMVSINPPLSSFGEGAEGSYSDYYGSGSRHEPPPVTGMQPNLINKAGSGIDGITILEDFGRPGVYGNVIPSVGVYLYFSLDEKGLTVNGIGLKNYGHANVSVELANIKVYHEGNLIPQQSGVLYNNNGERYAPPNSGTINVVSVNSQPISYGRNATVNVYLSSDININFGERWSGHTSIMFQYGQ